MKNVVSVRLHVKLASGLGPWADPVRK